MKQVLMVAALFGLLMGPSVAMAACSNPAGDEADQMYNGTHKVMQFCDGTDWIAMGALSPAAGGGGADWYQTSGTSYEGDDADTACDSGYHMCYPAEWFGNTYNTTKNASPNFGALSFIDGLSSFNCGGWTNTTGESTRAQVSPSSSTSTGWKFVDYADCGDNGPVLCCSD